MKTVVVSTCTKNMRVIPAKLYRTELSLEEFARRRERISKKLWEHKKTESFIYPTLVRKNWVGVMAKGGRSTIYMTAEDDFRHLE